mmetsp:Transcript_11684/g.35253  ORF Transcript_11684/g.35253 Transcript_11684/m.35253 type:complete len:100 (+) Transcript_11684:816-1115(+)
MTAKQKRLTAKREEDSFFAFARNLITWSNDLPGPRRKAVSTWRVPVCVLVVQLVEVVDVVKVVLGVEVVEIVVVISVMEVRVRLTKVQVVVVVVVDVSV